MFLFLYALWFYVAYMYDIIPCLALSVTRISSQTFIQLHTITVTAQEVFHHSQVHDVD